MAKKIFTLPWTMQELKTFVDGIVSTFNGGFLAWINRMRVRPFIIVDDDENKCKRVFLTREDADTWFKAREDKNMTAEIAALEFAGSTIPGTEQYKMTFNILNADDANTYGSKVILNFTFATADTLNANRPIEEPIEVFFTFSSDVGTKQISKIFPYSESKTEFDITEYIEPDVNEITCLARGRTSGLSVTQRATYNAVYLPFSSNFDIAADYRVGENFGIPYSLSGIGAKEVEFLIDSGTTFNDPVYEGTANKSYPYKNTLEPGIHTLQMKAFTTINGKKFESKLLFFSFVVNGDGLDLTTTMIKSEFPSGTSYFRDRTPGLIGEQYVDYVLNWAYFSTSKPNATVLWKTKLNGVETVVGSREIDEMEGTVGIMPDPVKFQPDTVGIYDLYAYLKGDESNYIGLYTINVAENSAGLREPENPILKLTARGRSNSEPVETRTDWSSNGYKTTFRNMSFDGLAGYTGDAVRFDNGAIGINTCKPFAKESSVLTNGGAVVFHFRTFNVEDENALLIKIGDINMPSTAFLGVYGKKVLFRPSNGKALEYEFAAEEDTHLGVVVHPKTGVTDAQMMFFIFNGVEAPGDKYGDTAVFNIGSIADTSDNYGMIHFGNADKKAAIDIYNVYVYPSMLSMWQGMNLYMINKGGNVAEMMRKNDLFTNNDFQRPIINKIKEQYRVLEIIGNLGLLETSFTKENFFGSCRYTDPFNPKFNFERMDGGAYIETAGQSRLTDLMAKSFHLDLNENDTVATYQDGKLCHKNRFIFAEGNIPENGVRIDLSGADSSLCRNASHMKMVNKYYPYIAVDGKYVLRTPPQEYALSGKWSDDMSKAFGGEARDYPWTSNINIAPDSVPIVVVWHEHEDDPIQVYGLAQMTEEKKASYANGNHSIYIKEPLQDGTLDPFDRYPGTKGERGWDNNGVEEIEYVNASDLTENRSVEDFYDEAKRDYSFELCFPKKKDLTDGGTTVWNTFLNEFLKPITNTYNNQSAFNSIIEDVIYMPSFAMYYNKCLDKKCNDSLCRNMHVIRYNMGTATNPKWRWWAKWWDVDVCCGLFQSNAMGVDPATDRQTKDVNDKYVMAGHDMWLWNALENNDTFKEWSRKLAIASYDAGWTANTEKSEQDIITNSFSESLYNLDGLLKFLYALRKGHDYMIRMQGSSVPYRHGFIDASYAVREAINAIGSYKARAVVFKPTGAQSPRTLKISAAAPWKFGLGTTTVNNLITGINYSPSDGEFSITIPNGISISRDFIYVYGADKIRTLDISDFCRFFESQIDVSWLSQAQKLWIGYRNHSDISKGINKGIVSFSGIDKMTRLAELSLIGLYGVEDLELSNLTHLNTLYISGTSIKNFAPADGTKFTKIEFPDTLQTIECRNVQLGNISFWNTDLENTRLVEMPSCPVSLLTLSFIGMGTDAGAHNIVHKWCEMLRNNEHLINTAQITYRNINWNDASKEDILTLSRIPESQRNLTGYIKCNEVYTSDERRQLTVAFGSNVFNPDATSITLVCDGEGDGISVSAIGNTVETPDENTVIVEQGNTVQFTGAGFPISGSNRDNYRWRVWLNGEWIRGRDEDPVLEFGSCSLNAITGEFTSIEDSNSIKTYRISCYDSSHAVSGEVEITVKPRTYPTSVTTKLVLPSDVSEINGVKQLTSIGGYRFIAYHDPSQYTGTINYNNDFWDIDGYDSSLMNISKSLEALIISVKEMPKDDVSLTIRYSSYWKNGLKLTAVSIPAAIVPIIERLLNSDPTEGNDILYHAMQALGVDPSSAWYSSMDLKKAVGTFSIVELVPDEVDTLTKLNSGEYYIPQYLKNIEDFDFSYTRLEGLYDAKKTPWARSINLENTTQSIIIGE